MRSNREPQCRPTGHLTSLACWERHWDKRLAAVERQRLLHSQRGSEMGGKTAGITSDIVGPLMMVGGALTGMTPLALAGVGMTIGGNLGGTEGMALGGA